MYVDDENVDDGDDDDVDSVDNVDNLDDDVDGRRRRTVHIVDNVDDDDYYDDDIIFMFSYILLYIIKRFDFISYNLMFLCIHLHHC